MLVSQSTLIGTVLGRCRISLSTFRLDQEKAALQKKLRSHGVTVEQVVGARTLQAEQDLDELKRRNIELEQHILTIK